MPKSEKTASPRPRARGRRAESRLESLDACRREIDAVDERLIALLDRRARICRRVGELKAEKGDAVYDAGRHLHLINGLAQRGSGDFPREGLRTVYGEILSACLNLQQPQTIACLAPETSRSRAAAARAFGRSARYLPRETIAEVFQAVETKAAHFGVVPIESASGGVIHATLDELTSSSLSICAEISLPDAAEGAPEAAGEIESGADAVTRFFIIGDQSPRPTGHDRTSIMFAVRDQPGALQLLLQPFADRKVNLAKIQSRPARRGPWANVFFIDIDGHASQGEVAEAIEALRLRCAFLRVLGSYPVERPAPQVTTARTRRSR